MKSILFFYANLLLKLSLTQSILITTFTSWIWCLWGGVHCQHIPPSVSGSSASLVAAWWEKLLPFFPDVLFQIHRCPWFLFVHLALEISSEEEVLRLGTLVPMNIEVPTKYPTESLFFKYVSTAKARCSTGQRSMATEMLWASLEERSSTDSPRQRFHSQVFCKIVRYFCRTLYRAQKTALASRGDSEADVKSLASAQFEAALLSSVALTFTSLLSLFFLQAPSCDTLRPNLCIFL